MMDNGRIETMSFKLFLSTLSVVVLRVMRRLAIVVVRLLERLIVEGGTDAVA